MPTLFSLLGMDYDSWFYGRDILADDFRERAFVATYQDLGYLEGDRFTVLSARSTVRTIPAAADGRRSLRAGTHRSDRQHTPQSCHFALSDLLAMEQTISKFPNPFGSVAPHKLFAWGLLATVGYGFAVWGVRIYQNQTVELGGATAGRADAGIRSARTALRCRPAPPPVSGRRDGALRRLALRTDSASCGECGSAWLYAWLLPLGNGSVSPLQETMQAGEVRPFWAASPFCAAFGA